MPLISFEASFPLGLGVPLSYLRQAMQHTSLLGYLDIQGGEKGSDNVIQKTPSKTMLYTNLYVISKPAY